MSKKNSIKKNYIYSAIYQLFTILIPIITTPYLSRTLLPDGIGKYSYTYSIVNYFIILSQLGFGYYAQREIAKHQDDKYSQSKIFFEIMIVKTISVSIVLIIYIISCFLNLYNEYTPLMWFWIILIITQEFDIAFLFQGNEEFKKIVIRNFIIKITGIIIIFAFVRTPDDIWIYILSFSLSMFLGAISLWMYLPKYICRVRLRELNPKRHIKKTFHFFIPTIAAIIYSYIDRTLIGILIEETTVDAYGVVKRLSEFENGFYEQSEKLIKVATSLITALGSVMLPRNANEYASGNTNQLYKNIHGAFRFVFMLGLPMMFGLIAVSSNLVPWFFGPGYEKCNLYIIMFSPLVILLGIDNVLGIQLLLTTNQEKKYSISIVIGTIINIILNIILIPIFYGAGAIVASIIAELIIIMIMYSYEKNNISLKYILSNTYKYFLSSIIMFIILKIINMNIEASIVNTFILTLLGGSIYFILLLLFRDELILKFLKTINNKIKNLKNGV